MTFLGYTRSRKANEVNSIIDFEHENKLINEIIVLSKYILYFSIVKNKPISNDIFKNFLKYLIIMTRPQKLYRIIFYCLIFINEI